jgi:hypothetical protein
MGPLANVLRVLFVSACRVMAGRLALYLGLSLIVVAIALPREGPMPATAIGLIVFALLLARSS